MVDGQLTGAAQYAQGLASTLYGPTSSAITAGGESITLVVPITPTKSYPPNTILPAGQTLAVQAITTGAFVLGWVDYAYP